MSDNLLKSLPKPKRIADSGRYETAVAIAKKSNNDTSTIYLATGLNFADALTGSVLAAKNNGTILLVEPKKVPSAVDKFLTDLKYFSATAIGGNDVVSYAVIISVKSKSKPAPESNNNMFENAKPIELGTKYTGKLSGYIDTHFTNSNSQIWKSNDSD